MSNLLGGITGILLSGAMAPLYFGADIIDDGVMEGLDCFGGGSCAVEPQIHLPAAFEPHARRILQWKDAYSHSATIVTTSVLSLCLSVVHHTQPSVISNSALRSP